MLSAVGCASSTRQIQAIDTSATDGDALSSETDALVAMEVAEVSDSLKNAIAKKTSATTPTSGSTTKRTSTEQKSSNANPAKAAAADASSDLTAKPSSAKPLPAKPSVAKLPSTKQSQNDIAQTSKVDSSPAALASSKPIRRKFSDDTLIDEESFSATPSTPKAIPGDEVAEIAAAIEALEFDDPTEKREAIIALQGMPASGRQLLLRTMRAAMASRNRVEERRQPSKVPTQSIAQLPVTQNAPIQSPVIQQPTTSQHSIAQTIAHANHAPPNATALMATSPVVVPVAAAIGNGDLHPTLTDANSVAPSAATSTVKTATHTEVPATISPKKPQPSSSVEVQLSAAIEALERELAANAHSPDAQSVDSQAMQARLRLLYLVAGRRDDALRPIAGLVPEQQEFWSKEVYGLAAWFDNDKQPIERRRMTESAMHLREAAQRLSEAGSLVVKNLHFCTEVKGYGIYSKFAKDEFKLGQEVLLYAEIENFRSRSTDKGFHTALKGAYQIFDKNGRRIAEKELAIKEEYCQNQRRDFFVPYFLWMPKLADDGTYTLKLTIEDVHRGEAAESTIDFVIKTK